MHERCGTCAESAHRYGESVGSDITGTRADHHCGRRTCKGDRSLLRSPVQPVLLHLPVHTQVQRPTTRYAGIACSPHSPAPASSTLDYRVLISRRRLRRSGGIWVMVVVVPLSDRTIIIKSMGGCWCQIPVGQYWQHSKNIERDYGFGAGQGGVFLLEDDGISMPLRLLPRLASQACCPVTISWRRIPLQVISS